MNRKLKTIKTSKVPGCFFTITITTERYKQPSNRDLAVYRAKAVHACFVNWKKPDQIELRDFDKLDDLWEFVKEKRAERGRTWLFVEDFPTNLLLLGMTDHLESGEMELYNRSQHNQLKPGDQTGFVGTICFSPGAAMMRCRAWGGIMEIVDLYNYYPNNSDALQKSMEQWRTRMTDKSNSTLPENPNAVRALYWADTLIEIFKIWENEDCGWWQPTASRLAKNAFQRYLDKQQRTNTRRRNSKKPGDTMSTQKHPPTRQVTLEIHNDKRVKEIERDGYFGGEARIFFQGVWEKNWYYVDVRSMYPYLCMQKKLPYKMERLTNGRNPDEFADENSDLGYMAYVYVEGADGDIPLRKRKDRASIITVDDVLEYESVVDYPKGNFATVLCGEELKAAAQAGKIKRVYETIVYRMGYVLKGFMEEWYEKRRRYEEAGNENGVAMVKLVMNALIGKFGQRGIVWEFAPEVIPPCPWGTFHEVKAGTTIVETYRSIGRYVQKRTEETELETSFIALPAFVCAAGRQLMRNIRRQLPEKSILMQDTDGMIVTEEGLKELTKLPEWNKEGPGGIRIKLQGNRCTIFSPKQMILENRLVMAGLPISGRILPTGNVEFETRTSVITAASNRNQPEAVFRIHITPNPFNRPNAPYTHGGWIEPTTIKTDPPTTSPYTTNPDQTHSNPKPTRQPA